MTIFIFVALVIMTILFSREYSAGIRDGLIKSYVMFFSLITLITEIATFFNMVSYRWLSLLWLLTNIFLIVLTVHLLRRKHLKFLFRERAYVFARSNRRVTFFLTLIGIVLFVTLFIALKSPPNNWDSMTYHMARIPHWIQNKSVHHYATSISRQNSMPPLAEYAIMHLQILSCSDRFANVVQWYSFLISMLVVSLIAGQFSLSLEMQAFSSLMVATIPMAILQSSSTQNDLVVGAFCLIFTYYLLKIIRGHAWSDTIFCSLSLGLALLAKGTAYIYCFSFGLIFTLASIVTSIDWKRNRRLLISFVVIAVVGLALNYGYFTRNYQAYGQVLPPATYLKNDGFSPVMLFSNLIRNAALHLNTPFSGLNDHIVAVIQWVLGDHLNDPKSTFMSSEFNLEFSQNEDSAGNPIHFFLGVLSLFIININPIKKHVFENSKELETINLSLVYWYSGAIVLAMVLYCILIKWQPWGSRLHTALFLLCAPMVAFALRYFENIPVLIAVVLFLYGIPFLVSNDLRPLISESRSILTDDRIEQYFAARGYLADDYATVVKEAVDRNPDEIGLYIGGGWEYPLWVLAGVHARKGKPAFQHIWTDGSPPEFLEKDLPNLIVTTRKIPAMNVDHRIIFESEHIRLIQLKQTDPDSPM